MGLLDIFAPKTEIPSIQSILPDIAKKEIMNGRLPILNTNKLFLKPGELCHYVDKAIYEKKVVRKRSVRKNAGFSTKGFVKGSRLHFGGGITDQADNVEYQIFRGILYITNQRLILQSEGEGFDLKLDNLVAITPYINCVEVQFSRAQYRFFVPDGNIVHMVLQLVKQGETSWMDS